MLFRSLVFLTGNGSEHLSMVAAKMYFTSKDAASTKIYPLLSSVVL